MRKRISVVFLLSLFTLFVFAGAALGAADANKSKVSDLLPMDGGQGPKAGFAPSPVVYEGKVADCAEVYPEVAINPATPVAVGFTYYDYQKNGSMGRMIAVGPAGHRHFIFHETRGDYNDYDRYITYNCHDGAIYWVGPTWVDGGEGINAGYVQMLTTHTGQEVIVYHRTDTPNWVSTMMIGDEGYICTGYFTNKYDLPDVIDFPASAAANGLWPKACIVYDAETDTDYYHYVVNENNPLLGGDQTFGYGRCVFQGANLVCHSPGYGPYTRFPNTANPSGFEVIAVVDTIKCIAPVIVSSPVSKKVAIVYTKHREDVQQNNDVMYVESDSNGTDWINGFNWPPTKINVTNYPAGNGRRAYTDVAACYDYNDNLHIVWNAHDYDTVAGTVTLGANLYHWSDTDPGVLTLIAAGPDGSTGDIAPGGWNKSISKMSVSAKDPIYHPGGDPDDSVYLFCTWTQFNDGDVSLGGWSNGDVYAAVSNDGGAMWAPGLNLTNTPSADCAAGECHSEHWSSLAENMYGGDLHVQYICDRDAGGIVQDEGVWTDADAMYMHVYQLPLETACGITSGNSDPASFTDPPLKVSPDKGSRVVTFDITGLYNLGGQFTVTSDNGSVAITGNSSGYLSPGQTKNVEVTVTCSVEGFIVATITVTGCIGTEYEGTIEIELYAVCSHDYYECDVAENTFITKDNGKLRLWVCSNSAQQVWANWIVEEDDQQVVFYGGTFAATIPPDDPSDTAIGRQEYYNRYTGARDTINRYCGEWKRYEPECMVQKIRVENTYIWKVRVDTYPPSIRWYWIDVYKQIYMFHDHPTAGPCPDWKKDVIVKHIRITFSRPPLWWPTPGAYPGHGDIYLGHYTDVDAPFDDGCNGCNTAGYDDVREMIWLHGYWNDTLPAEDQHPEYEECYVGLAFTDPSGGVVEPMGMQCVRNDTFLYPQDGWGFRTDQFYELITTAGENIQDPDSVVDRSVIMTSGMIPAGDANDTTFEAEYILIEAAVQGELKGTGLAELQAHMDDARGTMIPELDGYGLFDKNWKPPTKCGDVLPNDIVDSGDIVRLIGYVFLGESEPPWPAECRADVTGNGVIDSGDVVRLIGYVFLGESVPPCPDHCSCPEG
jgi:hypothetical protein